MLLTPAEDDLNRSVVLRRCLSSPVGRKQHHCNGIRRSVSCVEHPGLATIPRQFDTTSADESLNHSNNSNTTIPGDDDDDVARGQGSETCLRPRRQLCAPGQLAGRRRVSVGSNQPAEGQHHTLRRCRSDCGTRSQGHTCAIQLITSPADRSLSSASDSSSNCGAVDDHTSLSAYRAVDFHLADEHRLRMVLDLDSALDCCICYDLKEETQLMVCPNCRQPFCFACLQQYVEQQVKNGCVQIACPEVGCSRVYADSEVELHSDLTLLMIYNMNQAEAQGNPRVKACPGCNTLHRISAEESLPRRLTCPKCSLAWCFSCHAPWHESMTCRSYLQDVQGEGKRALKVWAKSKGKQVKNARKCPKCQFFIERIAGCDHMTCSRCKTDFCYSCGKRFYSLGILGSHYSRYSFLGCKYNLSPEKPVKRVAIRSAVAVATPLLALGVVALSPVILLAAATLYLIKKKAFRK